MNLSSTNASSHQPLRLLVRIRPIRSADAGLLADAFAALSAASRRARFLAARHQLSARELSYLTDVDHHDHEALVAVDRFRGRLLGVARFVRDETDPTNAEVAAEVIDEFQGRGIGTLLARQLVTRARAEGVTTLTARMARGNTRARRLLAATGPVDVVARDGATVTYRSTLLHAVR